MVSKAPGLRLSLALGSWQVVALAAALAAADDAAAATGAAAPDDVLVLYETGPVGAGLADAMREVAGAVRPWRVAEAWAAFADLPRRIGNADLAARVASLRSIAGRDEVAEVWLCRITRPAERLALLAWPRARVVLYEDGVLSYLPTRETAQPGREAAWPLAAWHRRVETWWPGLRLRRYRHALDPADAARLVAFWSLLDAGFDLPPAFAALPRHVVPAATLRRTVEACRRLPAVAAFAPAPRERPAVLVLGQALSRFHALPRGREAALYAEAVATVVDRGYDVWWKEHPRAAEPFLADVARGHADGRVRALELPHALPVELVADRLALAACVGGMTTALFYLPRLHGTPAYTFAPALAPHLQGDWALQNACIAERVAPLASLPPAP